MAAHMYKLSSLRVFRYSFIKICVMTQFAIRMQMASLNEGKRGGVKLWSQIIALTDCHHAQST